MEIFFYVVFFGLGSVHLVRGGEQKKTETYIYIYLLSPPNCGRLKALSGGAVLESVQHLKYKQKRTDDTYENELNSKKQYA